MRRISLMTVAAGVLLLTAAACPQGATEPAGYDAPGTVLREGNMITGTGTVRWFDIEGGFYAIAGDDGQTYDPLDLPADFRSNNLRVRFRARVRDDMAGIHMVGPIVEVVEISRL